jgi:hypothetical protein
VGGLTALPISAILKKHELEGCRVMTDAIWPLLAEGPQVFILVTACNHVLYAAFRATKKWVRRAAKRGFRIRFDLQLGGKAPKNKNSLGCASFVKGMQHLTGAM